VQPHVVRRAWQLRRAMLTWYCAKGSRHIDGKDLALPCQNFLFTLGGWSESELRSTLRWRPQHLPIHTSARLVGPGAYRIYIV